MRRVAIVCHDFDGWGGVATKARFLSRVLRDSGRYEVEAFNLAISSRDPASTRLTAPSSWTTSPRAVPSHAHGDPYTHVGAWFPELEFQRYRPRRVLEESLHAADVVHFVVGIPPWLLSVAPAPGRRRFLYLATMTRADRASRLAEASGLRGLWQRGMTRISERLEASALRQADHVFAVSRYTRDAVVRVIGDERVTLAPVGIDTEILHPSATRQGYLLSAGRIDDPRKNIRGLFAAYAELRRMRPSAPPLYLAGSRPTSGDLAYLRSLGIEESVRVFEHLPRARLAELFREAALFVLASDEEGLGIVILEAMASGTPVVSTACGGPATSVIDGETGLLVPVRNPRALAEGIDRLLADEPLRTEMGRRSRQIALERFSVAAAGPAILSVYDRLLY